MNYWLIKSEPDVFSWSDLEVKPAIWDGVRNYAARNNLKAMKKGDKAFFYHSNIGKEVVGIAEITKEHFPDPTTVDDRWVAVEVKAFKAFKNVVTLDQIKQEPGLAHIKLIKQSRLSVMPVTEKEYNIICKMGGI